MLLCPSRTGLQEMVDICQRYATSHKIQFSTDPKVETSKTKGIIFSNKKLENLSAPINLNGNALPWVASAKYLGNKITNVLDGHQQDATEKRAMFIQRNVELNSEFYLAHPILKTKINQIYNTSFSGSVL